MRNTILLSIAMLALGCFLGINQGYVTGTTPALAAAVSHVSFGTKPARMEIGITITIPSDSRGHFATQGQVGGQKVGFMVDTGASVVALNETSAALFGLRPAAEDYNTPVSTANGKVSGARTRLARLDIGGVVVHDVDALILPDADLRENLLGLSFLSKLKRFEYSSGKLVLEQ